MKLGVKFELNHPDLGKRNYSHFLSLCNGTHYPQKPYRLFKSLRELFSLIISNNIHINQGVRDKKHSRFRSGYYFIDVAVRMWVRLSDFGTHCINVSDALTAENFTLLTRERYYTNVLYSTAYRPIRHTLFLAI